MELTRTQIDSFQSKVIKHGQTPDESIKEYAGLGPCWQWTAYKNKKGYGVLGITNKKTVLAHRVSWVIRFGDIPEKLNVLHRCDNPECCNPEHLFLGTALDNAQDRERRKRGKQPSGSAHYSITQPWALARGDRNGARLHPERLARGDNHPFRLNPELVCRGDRHWSKLHPDKIVKGSQQGRAKLTEEKVLEIRKRYASGKETQTSLSKEFGVSHTLIGYVVRRKSWTHI